MCGPAFRAVPFTDPGSWLLYVCSTPRPGSCLLVPAVGAPPAADGVHQPFEPELDWRPWSVPVAEADIPRLHEVLGAIGPDQLAQMQSRLHCAMQHM